jgi:DNA-binding CsgD family transcriptional regulator
MGRSNRLRLSDVRAAFGLIGECRDLGADSLAWQRHALDGLRRLIGARVVIGGEVRGTPQGQIVSVQPIEIGLTPEEHTRVFDTYFLSGVVNPDPISEAFLRATHRLLTRTRSQLLPDRVWHNSYLFNECHRPVGIDHCLYSMYKVPGTGMSAVISLHRALGERDFAPRGRRLLHVFHAELGRLIGKALISSSDVRDVSRLSPRLRQTLDCLQRGDSEKQVASRLGLSRPTVHQYVMALYRHFGVGSRAELLAYFLRIPRSGIKGGGESG